MKIQLDSKNLTCMILTVQGPMSLEDARIIRVGFRKLLGKARNNFLIDLSQAVIAPEAEGAVFEIHIDALAANMRLVMIGTNPRVCQAPNLKEAQLLLVSIVRLEKVLVPQLHELHKRLTLRKDKARAALERAKPEERAEFIITENARLKGHVMGFEEVIEALLKDHRDPQPLGEFVREKTQLEGKVLLEFDARKFKL